MKLDLANKKKSTFGISEVQVVNAEDFKKDTVVELPIELLDKDENIRNAEMDSETELEQLGASIKEHGQLQPIVVAKKGDKYRILMGSRRYKACVKAGIKTMRCLIADDFTSEKERIIKQAIENEQRKNMSSTEREEYISQLEELGMTKTEIAAALHKALSWVTECVAAKEVREENKDFFGKLNFEASTRDAYRTSNLTTENLDALIQKTLAEGGTKEAFKQNLNEAEVNQKNAANKPSYNDPFFTQSDADAEGDKSSSKRKSGSSTERIKINLNIDKKNTKISFNFIKSSDQEFNDYLTKCLEDYWKGKNYKVN